MAWVVSRGRDSDDKTHHDIKLLQMRVDCDNNVLWRGDIVIDNRLQVTLADLPFAQEATIHTIDWTVLSERDGRRLRELGFDEGVAVEPLHGKGLFVADPIAVRIGRMTVAIRRAHAAAIMVEIVK